MVPGERFSRLMLSCSNFIILFFEFSFWVDIICPLNNINFYQELMFEIRKNIKNGTFEEFHDKYINIL